MLLSLKNRVNSNQTQIRPRSENKTSFKGSSPHVAQLPKHLQEVRQSTIQEAIDFITSRAFFEEKIEGKNWKNHTYLAKMTDLSQSPKALRERAEALLGRAQQSLGNIYKGRHSIMIPWSGGRDSSTILANSLAFFPEKKYRLWTVLNGMTRGVENPVIQFKRLLGKFERPEQPINIRHRYVDCVDDMKKHVIASAHDDRQRLGSPALCSACKMVMEKAMGNVVGQYSSKNLVLGYTKYQGIQDWVEQTPEQINFIQRELKKHGIGTEAPLYDVLEYPFDPILSLSSLGVPVPEHKIEMKCRAGGLNPKDLDKQKLLEFLAHKNEQTNHVFGTMQTTLEGIPSDTSRFESLIPQVEELRADKVYRDGVFEEKKYNGT